MNQMANLNPLTVVTDLRSAEFEFNSDPPYGDYGRWGIYVDAIINDPIISENAKNNLRFCAHLTNLIKNTNLMKKRFKSQLGHIF